MNASAMMKIVRGVVGKGGTIYNDKLKNGARSVKVEKYGWQDSDYNAVLAALTAAGFSARLTQSKNWNVWTGKHYMVTRVVVD